MGKSGYLPDISGNFTRWRQYYLDGLAIGNWSQVSLGLNNMNGSLDEEYRLPVNNKSWVEQEGGYVVWECPLCTTTETKIYNKGEADEYSKQIQVPTTSKRSDITIFTENCTDIIKLLTGKRQRKMWICPKCKGVNSVDKVESALVKYAEPHYRNCIYEEPIRPLTGLKRRRGTYVEQMKKWAKAYSLELEHKLALYRLEYIAQHGEDMNSEFDFKDKGDAQ
jgi:phage FluMu protein Com